MKVRTWVDNLVRGGACDIVIKMNGDLERWSAKPPDECLIVLDGVLGRVTPQQLLTLYRLTKWAGGCELKGRVKTRCGPALAAMTLLDHAGKSRDRFASRYSAAEASIPGTEKAPA